MSDFEVKILALIMFLLNCYNVYNAIINKTTGVGWWEKYSLAKSPLGFFVVSGMSALGCVICALLLMFPYAVVNKYITKIVVFLFNW